MSAFLRRSLICLFTFLSLNTLPQGIPSVKADTVDVEPEPIEWRIFLTRPARGEGVTELIVEQIQQYVDALLSIDSRYVRLSRSEFEGEAQGEPEPIPEPVLKKDKDLVKADKLLWQARDLIGKGPKKFKRAGKLLQKVIAIYARRFERMEDFSLMTEVLYESSRVFDAIRQRSNLRKVLQWLYTLRPDTVYDPRVESKSLLEAAKAEQERVQRKKGGKIIITTSPSNARIFVDGVDHGTSPAEVDIAVGGQHFVVAQLAGHKPSGKRVRITGSKKPKKVKLRLREIPRPKVKKRVVRKIKLSEVSPLITDGRFNRPTMNMLSRISTQSKTDVIIIAHVAALADEYIYSPFLYFSKQRKLVKVKPTLLPKNLATLQVALLTTPDRFAESISNPKKGKGIKGRPKAWTIKPPPPPKPKPIPVAPAPIPRPAITRAPVPKPAPTPAPVVNPVVPEALPKPVVSPEPAPVAEIPVRPSTTRITAEDERPGQAMPAIFKKWWFWTGAAVLVGGGVTTAIIMTQDSGFNTVVRW